LFVKNELRQDELPGRSRERRGEKGNVAYRCQKRFDPGEKRNLQGSVNNNICFSKGVKKREGKGCEK